MRRAGTVLLSALLLWGVLAGCAPREAAPAPTPTPPTAAEATPAPTPEPTPEPEPELQYTTYIGEVPHIFIHALVAYPEVKNGAGMMPYDSECIDVTEFRNLIQQLYDNGYSLVDLYDCYQRDENGMLRFREGVEVPLGRKPVAISMDDLVYDYRKRGQGMVDVLALDEAGEFVSGTYLADGSVDWSYDREAVPILEAFIREHPEFSSHGARMTLAMTGFAGVFGYRTEEGYSGDRQGEIGKARAVADALKERGYSFASHSYGHYDSTKHSVNSLRTDLQAFQDEVVPIIGPVSIYIYPYGKPLTPGDARYAACQEYGFELFCSVSHFFYSRNYDDGGSLYMTRVAVDGYSLRNYGAVLAPLFDVDKVLDRPNRP